MKMFSKALVCFSLVSALFAFSCGGVSAACISLPLSQPIFSVRSDGIGSIGTLKSSMLDDEAREFLRAWDNGGTDFFVTTDRTNLYFFKYIPTVSGNGVQIASSIYFGSGRISSVAFSCQTGEPVKSDLCRNPTEKYLFIDDVPNYGSGNMHDVVFSEFIQFINLTQYGFVRANDSIKIWTPVFNSPNGDFYVVFDDDLKEKPPPVSSEPEEPLPPVSSEPLPPYNYPDFPTIGKSDNEYVPYDTTLWNGFADYIKGSIGNAVNIGFLILAGILCIWIAIWLVKRFTK